MNKFIVGFLFSLFLTASAYATVVERVIYARNTLLVSDCIVTQTGLMELTVSACSWTTTGLSKVVPKEKVPNLSNEIAVGRVVEMPGGKEVRGWLLDKQGNIIEKSRTRGLMSSSVLTITAGKRWAAFLVDGPGITMQVALVEWGPGFTPLPGTLDYIILPFRVPVGTTDLSGIKIEVLTVRPGAGPAKGMFEK
ncbi:hypothetical protein LCGC14_1566230 [marine sediment metagenome]|uniref:Uncharacterized protein n=1 Tax=marine sediment metagenome TaxID=412755 RepID=A0A0F9LLJ9_9ZZZZ